MFFMGKAEGERPKLPRRASYHAGKLMTVTGLVAAAGVGMALLSDSDYMSPDMASAPSAAGPKEAGGEKKTDAVRNLSNKVSALEATLRQQAIKLAEAQRQAALYQKMIEERKRSDQAKQKGGAAEEAEVERQAKEIQSLAMEMDAVAAERTRLLSEKEDLETAIKAATAAKTEAERIAKEVTVGKTKAEGDAKGLHARIEAINKELAAAQKKTQDNLIEYARKEQEMRDEINKLKIEIADLKRQLQAKSSQQVSPPAASSRVPEPSPTPQPAKPHQAPKSPSDAPTIKDIFKGFKF